MKTSSENPLSPLETLRKMFPDSSHRTLKKWLKHKRFHIEGAPLRRDTSLQGEEKISIARSSFRHKYAENVRILFEDRYFIAIDKPVGLLSVPLDKPFRRRHALGILRSYYGTDQIFPVHRIDRETSGLLLFAKGLEAKEKFKSLFEVHDLEREYFAIVEGRLGEEEGSWESYLRELPSFDVQITTNPQLGKKAITHFKVLHRSAKYTYLRLLLETGRKHQIRVQCKAAGFPILGDFRYGASESPIRRLCLHASHLAFVHPLTGERLTFKTPLPSLFKKLYTGPGVEK